MELLSYIHQWCEKEVIHPGQIPRARQSQEKEGWGCHHIHCQTHAQQQQLLAQQTTDT